MFFFKNKQRVTDVLNGLYDVHSHLLPGVDDGSDSVERSNDILSELESFGVKGVFFTPHIMAGTYPDNNYERLTKRFSEFKNRTNVEIKLAAEYMVDESLMSHFDSDKYLMHNKNSMLVEFSNAGMSNVAYDTLFELSLKGITVILAHPERYLFMHGSGKLRRLEDAGCLLQLNLLSLSKRYGSSVRDVATKLLKDGRYTYVGTDTHNLTHVKLLKELTVDRSEAKSIKGLMANNERLFRA